MHHRLALGPALIQLLARGLHGGVVGRGLVRPLDELARESLTRQIDQALDLPGYDDDASAAAVLAGRKQLSDDDW